MNKEWLKIKNNANITEIYINGDITSDSDNYGFIEAMGLNDPNVYPKNIVEALKDAGDVHVHINSYGGDVFAGVAIANILKNHKGRTVAYIDGLAASSASIIAFGCDEIIIPSNAYLMMHRVSCGMFGNADDFLKQIEVMGKIEEGIINSYLEKAVDGVTREQIKDFVMTETWFTGDDTAKYFNVTVDKSSKYLNFVNTKQKFNKIPSEILNNIREVEKLKEQKEIERIENLKKEIEIELMIGG
jgi:endopeptidase clp|nr:MAG TPA: Putative ATP dependent Clp protease [Caudoviricetes sp.]